MVPVQIYSNQVAGRLQLKPPAPVFRHRAASDPEGPSPPSPPRVPAVTVSDSDEDEDLRRRSPHSAAVLSPSPPPESPVQKQSTKARRKLNEINRKLEAVTASPPAETRTRTRRKRKTQSPRVEEEDDDIIVVESRPPDPTEGASLRKIPLKIRCRTDVHKVPVLPTTVLGDVITQLSALLHVPAARLLLLRKEAELPADASVAALGLGIADIIDCVVMATEEEPSAEGGGSVTIRLQGDDRSSFRDFTLQRDAPLDSIFSQYVSSLPAHLRSSVRFHLDGGRVRGSATAAQLDLEDGDIIEVWT